MGKEHSIWERIMDRSSIEPESVPSQPIVEIAGECRVLIENHRGVAAYGREKILVKVPFGSVCICGCDLEMRHMSKEQLVIYGRIDSVGLQRRR